MLYNDKLKKEFIEYLVAQGNSLTIESVANRYFSTASVYEQSLNKDLTNFSMQEIIGLYKYVCTSSLEVLMQMNSLFNRYTYYCKDIGFIDDNMNHFEEVSYDTMKLCINAVKVSGSIISRKDLIRLSKGFLNASDSFLCLAIFEGLSGTGFSDLINLEISHFKNHKVYLDSGRVLDVSSELEDFAEESAQTYEFRSPKLTSNLYYNKNDNRILKDLCNTRTTNITEDRGRINLVHKLTRLRQRTECDALTYGHLTESGRIHMIKTFMKQDKEDNPRKVMSAHRDEITTRYNRIASYNRYLLKYSDYLINNSKISI